MTGSRARTTIGIMLNTRSAEAQLGCSVCGFHEALEFANRGHVLKKKVSLVFDEPADPMSLGPVSRDAHREPDNTSYTIRSSLLDETSRVVCFAAVHVHACVERGCQGWPAGGGLADDDGRAGLEGVEARYGPSERKRFERDVGPAEHGNVPWRSSCIKETL